ncbi:hypothetical protein LLEC1_03836 [Akanthomyces lecanii]|uniref:Agmatine deiminase n=1 Tax=Cordyceps confragosa TaxID=2714763 RepID=A0A179IMJ9_CORDF|nr:hypothetical protein LLEC1_03836 [Akanthomyces lecanii]
MGNDSELHRRAEGAPHKATILGWPGLEGILKDYPDRLSLATEEVSKIARAIAQFEPVTVIVGDERFEEAEIYFADADMPFQIKVHRTEDFGPTFLVRKSEEDSSLVGLDLNFNGWGDKYATPTTVGLAGTFLRDLSIERVETSISAEGGALETDGDGTLLVTDISIVNDNRNPGKSRQEIEDELLRTLGVEKVIWIPGRDSADPTACHVDALARFARPGVVLLSKANEAVESDRTITYKAALKTLGSATDARGRPFEIIEIEEPGAELFSSEPFDNCTPVRSYVNHVLVEGAVILPQFGDPAHDAAAIGVVQRVFGNDRRIVPVLVEQLPLLGRGPHAAAQEIPMFP